MDSSMDKMVWEIDYTKIGWGAVKRLVTMETLQITKNIHPMSVKIGTPLSPRAKKVLLCGSGELGKEVVIELQRLGVEVIAVDRYENAPAMQVAHRSHVISMLDGEALRRVIEVEKPDLIVPEIEAIATDTLAELENEGFTVIPTAKAAQLTMNREGIRRLAAEELGLKTSAFEFAQTQISLLKTFDHVMKAEAILLIFEIGANGSNLRQITDGRDDKLKLASQNMLREIGVHAVTPLCVSPATPA